MKKDSGVVEIHGKEYQTVALRVKQFREEHPLFTLRTDIVSRDEDEVVMKASILNEENRLIATGHAEEKRNAGHINKTSALENAETSAIGRCLAALGFGGTEFATADEVSNAIHQQKPPPKTERKPTKAEQELILKITSSHVFTDDEREKAFSFVKKEHPVKAIKGFIDNLTKYVKERKEEEKPNPVHGLINFAMKQWGHDDMEYVHTRLEEIAKKEFKKSVDELDKDEILTVTRNIEEGLYLPF